MHPVLALFRRNAWATERLLEFCVGRPEVAAPADGDVYGGSWTSSCECCTDSVQFSSAPGAMSTPRLH